MKLTDKTAIKLLSKLRSLEVEESIESYPEDEREGRTDLEMLADEVGYFYSLNFEEDTGHYDEYHEALTKLRQTKYGKIIPIDPNNGFRPKYGYRPHDIEAAKEIVNEVARQKRLLEKLRKLGIYSMYA